MSDYPNPMGGYPSKCECGATYGGHWVKCPKCRAITECTHCGRPVPPGDECTHCGAIHTEAPMTPDLSIPEPAPTQGDGVSIHDLVADDLADRKAFGLSKYGTTLQKGDGRRTLVDAYQEVLDLACYLRKALAEDDKPPRVIAEAGRTMKHGIPDHYARGLEPNDFIASHRMEFMEGMIVKLIVRHNRPGAPPLEDLLKVREYTEALIRREVKRLEAKEAEGA